MSGGRTLDFCDVIAVSDDSSVRNIHSWARKLKKLCRKSKTQFVKQEHNTQNAIALLTYLKRIALQQLMLRMQVSQTNFKAQRTQLQIY
jgi:hypothetical protein